MRRCGRTVCDSASEAIPRLSLNSTGHRKNSIRLRRHRRGGTIPVIRDDPYAAFNFQVEFPDVGIDGASVLAAIHVD